MTEFRRPTERELAALTQLDLDVFANHSYTFMSIRQYYDLAGPLLIIGTEGAALIGFGLALPSAIPGEGWFMALGVRAASRGSGVGRALASRVIAAANNLGITTLRLTVEPTNEAAIALYRTLGFEAEDLAADYFGPGEDRQVMCRPPSNFPPD